PGVERNEVENFREIVRRYGALDLIEDRVRQKALERIHAVDVGHGGDVEEIANALDRIAHLAGLPVGEGCVDAVELSGGFVVGYVGGGGHGGNDAVVFRKAIEGDVRNVVRGDVPPGSGGCGCGLRRW